MLDFEHFVTEYIKLSILLDAPIDHPCIELYYKEVQDFSNSMLTECFFKAGGYLTTFPLPVELKAIRNIILQRQQRELERQSESSSVAEVYKPMPDLFEEFMGNVFKFPKGQKAKSNKKRTFLQ